MKIEFSGVVHQKAKVFWQSDDGQKKKVGVIIDVGSNGDRKNLYQVATFDKTKFEALRPLEVGNTVLCSAYLNGRKSVGKDGNGMEKTYWNLELNLRTIDKTIKPESKSQFADIDDSPGF